MLRSSLGPTVEHTYRRRSNGIDKHGGDMQCSPTQSGFEHGLLDRTPCGGGGQSWNTNCIHRRRRARNNSQALDAKCWKRVKIAAIR